MPDLCVFLHQETANHQCDHQAYQGDPSDGISKRNYFATFDTSTLHSYHGMISGGEMDFRNTPSWSTLLNTARFGALCDLFRPPVTFLPRSILAGKKIFRVNEWFLF